MHLELQSIVIEFSLIFLICGEVAQVEFLQICQPNANRDVENLNQNDVQVATRLNINHTVSTKTITAFLCYYGAWWFWSVYSFLNSATVGYTGTLSNLEARFVFTSVGISLDDDAGDGCSKVSTSIPLQMLN